jgi:glycosyltransferase involved in cell wall biosynthesis
MRLCFIAEANSVHIEKWCRWFLSRGHEVHVISFTPGDIPGAKIHLMDVGLSGEESDAAKLKYLTKGKELRRIVEEVAPDVVNVHYATSYGAVAAFAGLRGYALSVWGSDIYDFPKKSVLHLLLLKYSLSRADVLFSTSRAMAKETRKYSRKPIRITPFGVDTELFSPEKRTREMYSAGREFRIGTVKKLDPKYGIDDLLRAAALVKEKKPELLLSVDIAGTGTHEEEYHELAEHLGIADIVRWEGFVEQEKAAEIWADLDLAVIPSVLDSESFGVSAVEAEACGVPVLISDVPGLMEATRPEFTSKVVPRRDPEALAEAIIQFADNPVLCRAIGKNGRRYAVKRYSLEACFTNIEDCLSQVFRD